ncbi:MAG: NADH-ubiquinone oxidoreductase-F iron-sulfur binding region domain-containing protein [Nocardioidaceae bacterium]
MTLLDPTPPTTSPWPRAAPDGARRLLAADGPTREEHLARFGALPDATETGDLVDLLERSGLRGRGGAGFPSARKLRSVAESGRGVVVANAAEGEPLSEKDRTLLAVAPHLVLDGLALAARAVGARRAYLVTARADTARDVRAQLQRRRDAVPVSVLQVEDRFLSGEESAVVNAVNGRPGLPSDRSVRVYERGVNRRPTLLHNVETLAHVALLARFGPEWFGSVGTTDEPGTFLATVSGAVRSPGVREVAFGSTIGDLVTSAGAVDRPQAVLLGGYHGAWVPGRVAAGTRLTRSALAPYGASVGAGVVGVLGRDRCGLVESAAIVAYLAGQVAGQCGPCVNGLPQMADALGRLAAGQRDPRLVEEVERMRSLVAGRGACAHPDGTVRFVASTLSVFSGEIAVHLGGGCSVPAPR